MNSQKLGEQTFDQSTLAQVLDEYYRMWANYCLFAEVLLKHCCFTMNKVANYWE